jgi:hypothetical protein
MKVPVVIYDSDTWGPTITEEIEIQEAATSVAV